MKRVGPKIDKSQLLYGMPERVQDDAYSKHVRTLPCIVTGSMATDTLAVDPAHIRMYADGGGASKPSDRFIVPLRHDLHQLQHNIGEVTFWNGIINGRYVDPSFAQPFLFKCLHALSWRVNQEWLNGK